MYATLKYLQAEPGAYGANRWDTATFENDADKAKFNKLMGVKAETSNQPGVSEDREGVLSGAAQTQVLRSVEGHFMQGLRRADGRKVGLGL